jgi:hypothetical protein
MHCCIFFFKGRNNVGFVCALNICMYMSLTTQVHYWYFAKCIAVRDCRFWQLNLLITMPTQGYNAIVLLCFCGGPFDW